MWDAKKFEKGLSGPFVLLLCFVSGIRVTSWLRSPSENERVGGVSNSDHLYGGAVDFGRETSDRKVEFLRSLGVHVLYDEGGTAPHYHAWGSWSLVYLVGCGLAIAVLWLKRIGRGVRYGGRA